MKETEQNTGVDDSYAPLVLNNKLNKWMNDWLRANEWLAVWLPAVHTETDCDSAADGAVARLYCVWESHVLQQNNNSAIIQFRWRI